MAASESSSSSPPTEPNDEDAAAAINELFSSLVTSLGAESAARVQWALPASIRQAKWDKGKALDRLISLSKFQDQFPQLFSNLTPEEFLPQAELGMNTYLPTRNNRGELVVLLECQKLNGFVKRFTQTDMMRFSTFLTARLMMDVETQVKGVIILENLKDYPMTAGMRLQGVSYGGMKVSCKSTFPQP